MGFIEDCVDNFIRKPMIFRELLFNFVKLLRVTDGNLVLKVFDCLAFISVARNPDRKSRARIISVDFLLSKNINIICTLPSGRKRSGYPNVSVLECLTHAASN